MREQLGDVRDGMNYICLIQSFVGEEGEEGIEDVKYVDLTSYDVGSRRITVGLLHGCVRTSFTSSKGTTLS